VDRLLHARGTVREAWFKDQALHRNVQRAKCDERLKQSLGAIKFN